MADGPDEMVVGFVTEFDFEYQTFFFFFTKPAKGCIDN